MLYNHLKMKYLTLTLLYVFGLGQKQTLTLNITNIQQSKGTLRIGIYDPTPAFGSDHAKPNYLKSISITKTDNQVIIFELPQGRYALAMYHDLNDNNKMDKNMVGFPKEPYGFSNNFRPKFSGPKFEDCAFELNDSPKTINIKLL